MNIRFEFLLMNHRYLLQLVYLLNMFYDCLSVNRSVRWKGYGRQRSWIF